MKRIDMKPRSNPVSRIGRLALAGERAEQVSALFEDQPDRAIRIGVVNGALGTARLSQEGQGQVVLEVELGADAPSALPITLIVALPRPPMLLLRR